MCSFVTGTEGLCRPLWAKSRRSTARVEERTLIAALLRIIWLQIDRSDRRVRRRFGGTQDAVKSIIKNNRRARGTERSCLFLGNSVILGAEPVPPVSVRELSVRRSVLRDHECGFHGLTQRRHLRVQRVFPGLLQSIEWPQATRRTPKTF